MMDVATIAIVVVIVIGVGAIAVGMVANRVTKEWAASLLALLFCLALLHKHPTIMTLLLIQPHCCKR